MLSIITFCNTQKETIKETFGKLRKAFWNVLYPKCRIFSKDGGIGIVNITQEYFFTMKRREYKLGEVPMNQVKSLIAESWKIRVRFTANEQCMSKNAVHKIFTCHIMLCKSHAKVLAKIWEGSEETMWHIFWHARLVTTTFCPATVTLLLWFHLLLSFCLSVYEKSVERIPVWDEL